MTCCRVMQGKGDRIVGDLDCISTRTHTRKNAYTNTQLVCIYTQTDINVPLQENQVYWSVHECVMKFTASPHSSDHRGCLLIRIFASMDGGRGCAFGDNLGFGLARHHSRQRHPQSCCRSRASWCRASARWERSARVRHEQVRVWVLMV